MQLHLHLRECVGQCRVLVRKYRGAISISTSGSVPLAGLKSPLFGSATSTAAPRTLITQPRTHVLENEYNRVSKRSVDANEV